MSKTIVKSVLGVVFLEGQLVLTKRRDIPLWVLPGGSIDEGETPEEAIIREVKEETGYNANIERKVALYTSTSKFLHPVYVYKLNVTNTAQDIFDAHEVKTVRTFDPKNLPKTIVPFYIDWIEQSLKDRPYFEDIVTSITPTYIIKTTLSHPIIVMRFFLSRLGLHFNT